MRINDLYRQKTQGVYNVLNTMNTAETLDVKQQLVNQLDGIIQKKYQEKIIES